MSILALFLSLMNLLLCFFKHHQHCPSKKSHNNKSNDPKETDTEMKKIRKEEASEELKIENRMSKLEKKMEENENRRMGISIDS